MKTLAKMNKPKVSIIVPVYNTEKYLRCCMNSLLNQTLKDTEIILVDDDSPDHCPAMCDEYAKNDDRIKVIHKKNEGAGYARNSGIEIATGEYIAFVDSDDYVELNAYQKLYSIIKDTKTDCIYCTACQRFNDRGDIWVLQGTWTGKRYDNEEDIRKLMLDMISNPPKAKNDRNIISSVWNALYCHDIIKRYEIKFKSERILYCEDLLFNLDYLLHSTNVIAISDAFYNYRVNLSSFTHTLLTQDKINKNYYYYQYLLEKLRENNFGLEGYLRATRYFIGDSRKDIRQYIQSSLTKREKIQWLKEVANHSIWREIASSYPHKKLPWKQALQFHLLRNGYCHLLYFLETIYKIKTVLIQMCARRRSLVRPFRTLLSQVGERENIQD